MNTLRYALRFLLRARTYTLINLLGLAFSLACCIILLRYIHRELTVDTHCVDREKVYAVQVSVSGGAYWGSYAAYRNDSVLIAPELIETKCSFVPLENDFLVSEGHRYRCDALATDSTFFQLFSYPLIQGEKNPFFSSTDPIVCTGGFWFGQPCRKDNHLFQRTRICGERRDWASYQQNLAEFRFASGKYLFQ